MSDTLLMISTTLGSAAVVAALAMVYYSLMVRSDLHKNHKTAHEILTGVVFGLFSVYCTVSAVPIKGGYCNCRNLAPLYAGLVAGPVSGIIAAVIGAGYRFFVTGGAAAAPCAIACMSAGIIGCILHIVIKKYSLKYNVLTGVIGSLITESLHMVIIIAFGHLDAAKLIAFPIILANAAGMAFCMYMYNCCKPDLRR